MTGAEKLMLGMFGGGWKLAGKPPGRPGCWLLFCCMPGGVAVPGAAIPGGGAEAGQFMMLRVLGTFTFNLPMPGGAPGYAP